jgi:hypothetical protein
MHHRRQHKQAAVAQPGLTGLKLKTPSDDTVSGMQHHGHQVSVEDIRLCAYQKWVRKGKPSGDGTRFWLDAEKELTDGR